MSQVQVATLISVMFLVFLCVDIVYLTTREPSKILTVLYALFISTFISVIGYVVEINAKSEEAALLGNSLSYLGKPLAAFSVLAFIAEYCGKELDNKKVIGLLGVCIAIFVAAFTNGYHHLFYSTVTFDRSNPLSPVNLNYGAVYYLYLVYIVLTLAFSLYFIVTEYRKCDDKESKRNVVFLSVMLACTALGQLVFHIGGNSFYDATILASLVGVLIITVLYFKYNIVDYLTMAKNKALEESSTGVIVFDNGKEPLYINQMMRRLLQTTFKVEELTELGNVHNVLMRDGSVYEVKIKTVADKDGNYGKTFEINDITATYNYSSMLEAEVLNRTKKIKKIQESIVMAFADLVEARDVATGEHIKKMSQTVEYVALELIAEGKFSDTLSDQYVTKLVSVSPLHDVGKICIPDAVLLKPEALTDEEFEIMKTHSVKGAEIIDTCLIDIGSEFGMSIAKDVAKYHHEKWDGTGYPEGLKGEEIPLSARIVAIADVFDALISERCYKKPIPFDESVKIIYEGRGTKFDPDCVDAFMQIAEKLR